MVGSSKAKMRPLSKEEILRRQWQKKQKENYIVRARANVVRSQITRAYEILENVRLDYLGDTAFRDDLVMAKRGLESMLSDFLLYDPYWERKIKEHRGKTPEQFDKEEKKFRKMCVKLENPKLKKLKNK